jgi:hypothetical protein
MEMGSSVFEQKYLMHDAFLSAAQHPNGVSWCGGEVFQQTFGTFIPQTLHHATIDVLVTLLFPSPDMLAL